MIYVTPNAGEMAVDVFFLRLSKGYLFMFPSRGQTLAKISCERTRAAITVLHLLPTHNRKTPVCWSFRKRETKQNKQTKKKRFRLMVVKIIAKPISLCKNLCENLLLMNM